MTIIGTPTEDQTLTATNTLADADGLGSLHYQWERDGGSGYVNVGMDQSTYTLVDADVGAHIRVVVSYTDGHGTAESVTSTATPAVANVNDGQVSQLVQVMAGFGGGSDAADGLSTAPFTAETSQQTFLTTPQHA